MIPENSYLRNILLPDHFDAGSGIVFRGAFKPRPADRGQGISITSCSPDILSESDIEEYLDHASRDLGGLRVGCCAITQDQVEQIDSAAIEADSRRTKNPPPDPAPILEVAPDPLGEGKFDRSHCLLRDSAREDLCPPNAVQRILALHATVNGILIPPREI